MGEKVAGHAHWLRIPTIPHAGRHVAAYAASLLLWLLTSTFTLAQVPPPLASPDLNIRSNGSVSEIVRQPDGKWLVLGTFTAVQGRARSSLARLNADGSLDAGFAPVVSGVSSLAADASGIYLAGSFDKVNGVARPGLAKLTLDGELDEGWQVNVVRDSVKALAISDNGWVWLGGEFSQVNNVARDKVARVDSVTGALGSSTPHATGNPDRIVAHATGIYIHIAGAGSLHRRDPDTGDYDANWGSRSAKLSFVIEGEYLHLEFSGRVRRVRLDTGEIDSVAAWSATLGSSEALVAGTDGACLFTTLGRCIDLATAGFVPGADLGEFRAFGSSTARPAIVRAAVADGRLLVAGSFDRYEGRPAFGIVALDATTREERWEGGIEAAASVNAVLHLPDGSHLIGGDFIAIDNASRTGLARLLPDGTLDPDWAVELAGVGNDKPAVTKIALGGDAVYVAGRFSQVAATARYGLAKLSLAGQLDTQFVPGAGCDRALLVRGDGVFLGCQNSYTIPGSGGVKTNPVKLDAQTGAVVPDWISAYAPNSRGVYDLADASDGLLAAGGDEGSGSERRHGLAKLSFDTGARIAGFEPALPILLGSYQTVSSLFLDGDAVFVGARATYKLVAATGESHPDWLASNNGVSALHALGALGSRLFVGGLGTFEVNGSQRSGLYARNRITGRLDYRWAPDADGEVKAISADAEGRLWVGGAFSHIGGQARRALAVLPADAPPSTDVRLHDVTTNVGTPSYSDDVDEYELTANPAVSNFAVTATPVNPDALLFLDGRPIEAGTPSHGVPLRWGRNEYILSVLADDRIARREIRLIVHRNAAVACDATRRADLEPAGIDFETIATLLMVRAEVRNRGPSAATPNYSTPFGAVTFSLGFYHVAPDGSRGALFDAANYSSSVSAGASAIRSTSFSPHYVTPGQEVEMVVDYFCDPDESNNSLRFRYPADGPLPPSDDARLYSLVAGSGFLTPAFSPDSTDYHLPVAYAVDRIAFTATVMKPGASLTVAGASVVSGSASAPIALAVGTTTVPIVVTAPDGEATQTYTVAVERAAVPMLSLQCLRGAAVADVEGERHEYGLVIENQGASAVAGLRLVATLPHLGDAAWTCAAPLGCDPGTGTGDIDTRLVHLAHGDSALAEVSGLANPDAAFVEIHAELRAADGGHLSRCSLVVPANDIGLLRSGFEE